MGPQPPPCVRAVQTFCEEHYDVPKSPKRPGTQGKCHLGGDLHGFTVQNKGSKLEGAHSKTTGSSAAMTKV